MATERFNERWKIKKQNNRIEKKERKGHTRRMQTGKKWRIITVKEIIIRDVSSKARFLIRHENLLDNSISTFYKRHDACAQCKVCRNKIEKGEWYGELGKGRYITGRETYRWRRRDGGKREAEIMEGTVGLWKGRKDVMYRSVDKQGRKWMSKEVYMKRDITERKN